jgi:hypothetical protein
MGMSFPGNKAFAFTIFDDTDGSTPANVGPVYECLHDLGFRTTKSVWPVRPTQPVLIGGDTLDDPANRKFALELQEKGFELAYHNATSHGCTSERAKAAMEQFRSILGDYPKVHCNHYSNMDNLYWGAARLRGFLPRLVYRLATIRKSRAFEGHVPSSPYFWGDLCRQHVQYVRNFVFREINILNVNPTLPYHDPSKPYVNWWFSSTEAGNVRSFVQAIGPEAQERLEAENGVCIMYTHFSNGFARDGAVDPEFRKLMTMLAKRNGWFVPVGQLLDYLKPIRGGDIPPAELRAMEWRWIGEKLRHGTS